MTWPQSLSLTCLSAGARTNAIFVAIHPRKDSTQIKVNGKTNTWMVRDYGGLWHWTMHCCGILLGPEHVNICM